MNSKELVELEKEILPYVKMFYVAEVKHIFEKYIDLKEEEPKWHTQTINIVDIKVSVLHT